MALEIGSRIKNAWNAFRNRDPTTNGDRTYNNGYYANPYRVRMSYANDRSIITAFYNKIAIDVASIDFKHCRLDKNKRFESVIDSSLNECLTLESNIDQNAFQLKKDIALTMCETGVAAVVPVDATSDPTISDSYDVNSMRVGEITEWFPRNVKVKIYDDHDGTKKEIILPKKCVAIIDNPFYQVMNAPNAAVKRLARKLAILDAIDEQSGSGKLDLIIQLPYSIKTEARRVEADKRKDDIERQLANGKYGIAYIDSTEHITQLNRPVENNLMAQIQYLMGLVQSQIGIDETILNGTANEQTVINYEKRTIVAFATAIALEFKRKFLSKTARTQGQSIEYFTDPFRFTPVSQLAEISDKFSRNEIMTSNEIRQKIGLPPSSDPKADELRNSNLNHPDEKLQAEAEAKKQNSEEEVTPKNE